jgi:iron complex transport system permease protein
MTVLSRSKLFSVLGLLFVALVLSVLLTLYFGPVSLNFGFSELLDQFFRLLHSEELSKEGTILFRVRLPRTLLAVLVGGGLALSGASFQALLRNPLADPYILGVSGGAALAAIIGMVVASAFSFAPVPIFAFGGALIAIFLVLAVARSNGRLPVITLLLAGVVVNAFFSALVMFVLSVASGRHLPSAIYWMMGQLSPRPYSTIGTVALYYLPGVLVLFGLARDFNLFSLGEESAQQLGVNVERSKLMVFLAASLVTAVAVSVSGLIGFVGLIVPHIIRLVFGPDHRLLLPASFLFGALFLVLCDLLARVIIAPAELSVGVITAILGGPFFIWLLHKSRESLGR